MSSLLDTPFAYRTLETLGSVPGRFLPVADLLQRLGGHSDDLQQALAALKRVGYRVEEHPVAGICLRTEVEVIRREAVQEGLETEALGRILACYLEVGSTNDLAVQAALEGAPHGAVITAEHQTAGRGRRGRVWFSPPGAGLWFSSVVRFNLALREMWMLTLGAGVAVVDAVQEATGLAADLKWPNDVRIDGRKLAGILTETRPGFAVLGIGINVNQEVRAFPDGLRETATSLRIESGRSQERSALLRALLYALESVYADLDPDRICKLWKARSTMWGQPVHVAGDGRVIEGVAEDLAPDGALCVRTSGGVRVAVQAGDFEFRIPESGMRI